MCYLLFGIPLRVGARRATPVTAAAIKSTPISCPHPVLFNKAPWHTAAIVGLPCLPLFYSARRNVINEPFYKRQWKVQSQGEPGPPSPFHPLGSLPHRTAVLSPPALPIPPQGAKVVIFPTLRLTFTEPKYAADILFVERPRELKSVPGRKQG